MQSASHVLPVLPKSNPKSIRYVSLDLDGCLFNKDFKATAIPYDAEKEGEGNRQYLRARTDALLKVNEGLVNGIVSEVSASKNSALKLMVGSNRQDCNIDGVNAFTQRVGSLAPAMYCMEEALKNKLSKMSCELDKYLLADTFGGEKPGTAFDLISKDLRGDKYQHDTAIMSCELDKYLLADTFGGKKPGTAFDLISKDLRGDKYQHDTAIVDEYKWLLIFAQTHKAASENLFSHVTFDFYDDHNGHLKKLHDFYARNPDLLPENLILRLHHYDGKKYSLIGEIQGQTKALEQYGEGVLQMLKCAGYTDQDIKDRQFDTWKFYEAYANPDVLDKFKKALRSLQGLVPVEMVKLDKPVKSVKEEVREVEQPGDNVAAVVRDNDLSPEMNVMNDHITELKRNFAHQANINELVQSLEVARDAISDDFKRMRANKFTDKKIQKSNANQSLKLVESFLVKLRNNDPVVQHAGVNEFITNLQTQTRKNKFLNVLWGVAVTAVCFVVGAGVGFAVGLGIGAATGPGAIFTSIAGALVGGVLAAVIGAGVGGGLGAALGGTFFGRYIYKKANDERPTSNAMQDVSRKVAALRGG